MLCAADLAAAAVSGVAGAAGCGVAAGAVVPGWDEGGAVAAAQPVSAIVPAMVATVQYRRDEVMVVGRARRGRG